MMYYDPGTEAEENKREIVIRLRKRAPMRPSHAGSAISRTPVTAT